MIVVLNNKSNLNQEQFLGYQKQLEDIISDHKLVLCPSNIYLADFYLENLSLGVQNVSPYEEGAYTGEIASSQLKSLGVSYAIVGHSERRLYFHENEMDLKKKIESLLKYEIIPILCIGEMEKQDGLRVVESQLEILKAIDKNEQVIIAYEPVWAIGTGQVPTIEEVEKVISFIKGKFPQNSVIYGGSVNEENIYNLKSSLLNGYLLGGLSLKPDRLRQFLNQLDR
ncbi:MAG: triosephosphate isomerase [Bacilli bacterium]|nr:triosephosphate isomerase [Bacilli bacterium]